MADVPQKIRILVADDHPLLRGGVAALLSSHSDMLLVGEASTGQEAIEKHRALRPDITLMVLQMNDLGGIEAISCIRHDSPTARIIVLTTYAGDALAQRALKAGAQAYMLKSSVRKDLLETIRAVHSGLKRIHRDVAAELAHHTTDDALSQREIEVLSLVASGHSNRDIAIKLDVTEGTVKGHAKQTRLRTCKAATSRVNLLAAANARSVARLSGAVIEDFC
jgi:DNA-binding NarL/FixJ family response regulator